MKLLTFVRHGQSTANAASAEVANPNEEVIGGQRNFSLTDKGILEARSAGERIRKMCLRQNHGIDFILLSKLRRAVHTAHEIH